MEHGNIAAGYRTDLDNLIQKFEQKKSARYSDFVTTWQEIEFWRVCYGRKLEHDKADFMDTIFLITVEFLNQNDFEAIVVITALYTLYGLWNCQRLQNKHRIRLTFRQYGNLEKFAQQMAAQGHTDFFAIYQRMVLERAFDIAIFNSPYMLGQYWQENGEKDECSGFILDDEFHQFSSATVLNRLRKRAEPAFACYQQHQTRLLQNLPPNEEPIEFNKNISPTDEMGEIVAKLAQLEHRLTGDDQVLGLEPDRDDLGARRRRIRERALNRGVSLNDSDMSISPTKQVEINDEINKETEALDSYKPKYVLNQAAPKSVQRLKRGRPFVKGVEEREYSETDYRGGIFRVAKTKRRNNADSGISSPGSGSSGKDEEAHQPIDIVKRIEKYVTRSLEPLRKKIESEERTERIKQHMEELEEAERKLEEKRIDERKREAMRKEILKARKKLERRQREFEKEEKEKEKSKEESNRGRKRKQPRRKIGGKPQKEPADKKMKKEVQFNAEEMVAGIKTEIERQEDSDSDDDKPLALMAPPKTKSKGRKRPSKKLTDLNDLNDNDYVMINPAGLDHSMLPDERPLIAKIVEVNREDDYIDAEWMMMKSSSIGKMLYEYSWERDSSAEPCTLVAEDIFEKVDLRKGQRLSAAQAKRCATYYPDYEFD